MAADIFLLLLINGLFMCSIVGASDWSSPYFKPPPKNENVIFTYNPEDESNIVVYIKEESHDITIALINFDDSATEPLKSPDAPSNVIITYDQEAKLWAMQVKNGFDAEVIGGKTMNFAVYINNQGHRVSLIVQNINDNRPTFSNPDRTCKIYENTMTVPDNCSITIGDMDHDVENATVKLDSQIFSLSSLDSCTKDCPQKTFKLNLKQQLDFETAALHTLTIEALDPDFPDYVGSINYIIQVIDEPDQIPKWSRIYSSLEVTENHALSINITATDGDLDVNAEINYKIEIDDSFKEYIGIDESTGLFTIKEMDRETLNSDFISLNIIAFEKEDVSSAIEQSVIIVVHDENDNAPTFSISEIAVSLEEVSTGTMDIGKVTITDLDSASYGQFSISLKQSEFSEAFIVVPSQGYQSVDITLSIVKPNLLNFETENWRNFDLEIIATETNDSTHVGSATIHVTLTDKNDEWPVFNQEMYQVTLPERSPIGTLIVQVSATDGDVEDKILDYEVIPSRSFIVDSNGTITINNEMALDYEQSNELHLQISAKDSGKHFTYAEVVITVTDVNDEPPVLEPQESQVSINEKSDTGTTILNITASDVDADADLEITIDWDKTTATRRGSKLESNENYKDGIKFQQSSKSGKEISGSLIVNDPNKLNWYYLDTLNLMVIVKDKNTAEGFPGSHQLFITINILDRNDNPPVFTKPDQEFSVLENQPHTLIGTILATDNDGEGNNNITFSITAKDPTMEGLVEINLINGELQTVDGIDCEKFSELFYAVKASDGVSETPLDIKIMIIDTNDETPIFKEHDASYTIKENSESGQYIVTLEATDADVQEEYRTIYYELDESDNDNSFYIGVNSSTGEVTVQLAEGKVLNREDPKLASFLVTIIARDNYKQFLESNSKQNKTSFTLKLEDENDEKPVFDVPNGCFPTNPVFESIVKGAEIATLQATDADDPETDNSKISYEIISSTRLGEVLPQCEDIFDIIADDANNMATIIAKKDLSGCWGKYETVIKATDKGSPPQSSTGNYIICIYDVNDNSPTWETPKDGEHIRIREDQTLFSRLLKNTGNPPNVVPDLWASDKDDGENGKISYELEGNTDFFDIRSDDKGYFLTLVHDLLKAPVNKTRFDLSLIAKDNGTIPRSTKINVQMVVFITIPHEPIFTDDCTLEFSENTVNGFQTIPSAYDENNQNVENVDDMDPINYFIVSGADSDLFKIDMISGNVTLTKPLDREESPNRTLYIVATNNDLPPAVDINKPNDSVLKCDINVKDINDNAPIFSTDSLVSGFGVDDDLDTEILRLQAIDDDENDPVTYRLNGVRGSTSDLQQFEDKAFYMNEDGRIRLAFQPTNKNIQGLFTLSVLAMDSAGDTEGHVATAEAKIFIISDANRVTFQFNNPLTYVNESKLEIEDTFREGFNYTCGVDKITSTLDSDGIAIDNSTDVVAHFIDANNEAPINKQTISQKFYEQTTFNNLQTMFWGRYKLDLKNFIDGSSKAVQSMEQILQITLIAVSVVLGSMLIILFIAFYLRTKALNRRLLALSTTKFGSQESDLNRIGVAVPNTNKHAVEGSNPIYGGVERPDFDTISQGSGGSALIGIEDKPEFQSNYMTSGHYLSGGLGSRENYQENFGYEFDKPNSKPVTEL